MMTSWCAAGAVRAAQSREPRLIYIAGDRYPVICARDALTFLSYDEALTVVLLEAVRDAFVAALRAWADHHDALDAWYKEVRKVAPDVDLDELPF